MTNLIDEKGIRGIPLSERVRPKTIQEFYGQSHLLGEGKPLRKLIEFGNIPSSLFWGPPGTGKTTLAYIIAEKTDKYFVALSAVLSGVKEVREIVEKAKAKLSKESKGTILFIDELHRFNKSQQDAFLPYLEKGIITLIGATTENPSFEINSPLLSRLKVFMLTPLDKHSLDKIVERALKIDEILKNYNITFEQGVLNEIYILCNGDARCVLDTIDISVKSNPEKEILIDKRLVSDISQKLLPYDKSGEEHYNLISALHKSIRGSNPDAALYYLARMLEGGEDPLYIARRLMRIAMEDVGMADPFALTMTVSAKEAVRFVGMPEADLALVEAVVYLAQAPKSNSLYTAYGKAKESVISEPSYPVPLHLRNAPTSLMKKSGYGKGYKYPHNYPGAFVIEDYFPEELKKRRYYQPTDRGYEKKVKDRLEKWKDFFQKSEKKT